jgi:hypothetical protein
VGEVVDYLEYIAPPDTGTMGDPFGLQTGAPGATVRSIVVSATASFDALGMAASRRESMLITAAPLITSPMTAIRSDDPIGGKIAHAVEHRVSLYALPNSFASARGGFDDSLAETLGLAGTSMLMGATFEAQNKIAVFVPVNFVDQVRKAAADAGAGQIGNYTSCSFQTQGTGTFIGGPGSSPTVGAIGRLERVEEVRLEMQVAQRDLSGVLAAIIHAHPYEEVAYDVFPVKNPGPIYGRGRIGELPLKVSLDTILAQVQDALEVDSIRCSHKPGFSISTLAVASGAQDGLVWNAIRSGAGALVVGSVSIKDLTLADNSMTVLIDIGYSASLAPGLMRLCEQLSATFESDGVEVTYCA